MTPEQAYEWLAPKLSISERKVLDVVYQAAVVRGEALVLIAEGEPENSAAAEVARVALGACVSESHIGRDELTFTEQSEELLRYLDEHGERPNGLAR